MVRSWNRYLHWNRVMTCFHFQTCSSLLSPSPSTVTSSAPLARDWPHPLRSPSRLRPAESRSCWLGSKEGAGQWAEQPHPQPPVLWWQHLLCMALWSPTRGRGSWTWQILGSLLVGQPNDSTRNPRWVGGREGGGGRSFSVCCVGVKELCSAAKVSKYFKLSL